MCSTVPTGQLLPRTHCRMSHVLRDGPGWPLGKLHSACKVHSNQCCSSNCNLWLCPGSALVHEQHLVLITPALVRSEESGNTPESIQMNLLQPEMQDSWRQREKESQVKANLELTVLAGSKKKKPQVLLQKLFMICATKNPWMKCPKALG